MTDKTTNEQIAEALGLKIVERKLDFLIIEVGIGDEYPGCWHNPHLVDVDFERELKRVYLPDYSYSVNAALELVGDMEGFSLNRIDPAEWPGRWEAIIKIDNGMGNFIEWENSPALAICKVWLAWRQSNG